MIPEKDRIYIQLQYFILVQDRLDLKRHKHFRDLADHLFILGKILILGQLLSEQGDNLELFADKREDEAKLISFLAELDKENGEA